MRPRHGFSQRLGGIQQAAQIFPDQGVELVGGGIARRAARGAMRAGAMRLAAAQIVEVPPIGGPCRTGETAATAAHQRAQEILLGGVVAPGEGAVGGQLGLHLVKVRLAHHRGHLPDQDPGIGGLRHGTAMSAANRVRGRAAVGGSAITRALRIDLPRIGRVAQDASDRRA